MNKVIFAAIAMDLKRAALGYHRGSPETADRFFSLAQGRKKSIDITSVKPYLINLLEKIDMIPAEKDMRKKAEFALMYSTLFQNAALATDDK